MRSRTMVLVFLLALASSSCSGPGDETAEPTGTPPATAVDVDETTAEPEVIAVTAEPEVGAVTAEPEVGAVTAEPEVGAVTAEPEVTEAAPSATPEDPPAAVGPQVCGSIASVTGTVYIEIVRGA